METAELLKCQIKALISDFKKKYGKTELAKELEPLFATLISISEEKYERGLIVKYYDNKKWNGKPKKVDIQREVNKDFMRAVETVRVEQARVQPDVDVARTGPMDARAGCLAHHHRG